MSTFNTLTSFNFGENFKFYRIRNFNFPEKLRKIVKNRLFLWGKYKIIFHKVSFAVYSATLWYSLVNLVSRADALGTKFWESRVLHRRDGEVGKGAGC